MSHINDGVIDYGATPSTTFTTGSTDQNINGILVGRMWTDFDLSYSFPDLATDYSSGYADPARDFNFSVFSAAQIASTESWLDDFASVSGLTFTRYTGAEGALDEDQEATLRFANSSLPGTAYAYYPNSSETGGDSWFGPSGANPVLGNYDSYTIGHEIGHTLGLSHGQSSDGGFGTMNADRDSMEFSIMTYRSYVGAPLDFVSNEGFGFAQSLMMYDIAAVQFMYGANFNSNAGSTTYTFSTTTGEMFIDGVGQGAPGGNRIFRTIWDGNGAADHYDFSNYSTNTAINLNPGNWVDLDTTGTFQTALLDAFRGTNTYARGHVFNALQFNGDTRSLIENASGGSGNDIITGNIADNTLWGNGGNDTLYGGGGNDTLYGGSGLSAVYGGADNDTITDGNSGTGDTFDGGTGIDTLIADFTWVDAVLYDLNLGTMSYFGTVYDTITGIENLTIGGGADVNGDGNDNIITILDTGPNSSNTINAGGGADTVYAGIGNDIVNGEAGNDTIYGGEGNDTLYGGIGTDNVYGDGGDDVITILGGDGLDNVYGGAGTDTLDYSDTSSTIVFNMNTNAFTFNGIARDAFDFENYSDSAGVSTINGTAGVNIIYGNAGNDTIQGRDGSDFLYGGDDNDTIRAGRGGDTVDGGNGADTLEGFKGYDDMFGGAGSDSILGGKGNDTMTGGGDADAFYFLGWKNEGADTVTDFTDGVDSIMIGGKVDFGDISILASGSDTLLSWRNTSVLLEGVTSGLIDAGDFIFV